MTIDPRQARTSAALRAALVRLLAHRPLDTISVSELCREAGVHRTTFYKHAKDVDRFAVATFSADLDALAAVSPESDDPVETAGAYLAAMRGLLEMLAEQRPVYRALFASSARGAFRAAVGARLVYRVHLALEHFAASGVVGAPRIARDQDEAAAFIAGALVGMLDVWTQEDDTDADAAASRVLRLMPGWWPVRA